MQVTLSYHKLEKKHTSSLFSLNLSMAFKSISLSPYHLSLLSPKHPTVCIVTMRGYLAVRTPCLLTI